MYHQNNQLKIIIMRTLTISVTTFNEMILGLIQSGVTFEAHENKNNTITINFTGGF